MNLKRTIAGALALGFSLSLLAGCGPKQEEQAGLPQLDPEHPVSIELWHYYNSTQKTAFDEMVREFNETVGLEQGIIVEAFSQGNVDGLITKVTDAAAKKVGADEVPNIFAAYADTAFEVDKLGLLADLSPYLTEEELAQYRPEFIQEGHLSGDDQLKIFPVAKAVEVLMLNQTDFQAFADATGASVADLATFEGVTRTAEAYYNWTDGLTDAPDDGKAFFGRDAMANYFIIGCRQLGQEIFTVQDGQVALNADEEVFRRLWDNYYVPFVNGYFATGGKFRTDDAHMGDIIALVGSSSGASYFPTEVAVSDTESYPIDCTVLPAPVFEGGEPYAIQQGAGMSVTKSDAKTEYACTVFLKWFTDTERNTAFAADSGYLPVKNDALDLDVICGALGGAGQIDPRIEKTFTAALDELNACTLYTTSAFDGGNAARGILETSLKDKAAADRAAVVSLMESGMSRAEAVAQYDTDASFDAWYAQICADLTAACAG